MSKRHRGFIENFRPRAATSELIERVQAVLAEYVDHLPLTIRQIFYRLIGARTEDGSVGYEKTEQAYKRLIEAIGKARRGGLIDFDAIRDDGVVRETPSGFDGIDNLMESIRWRVDHYSLNRQIGQPTFTIIGCEAAGMVPQLARVADPFGVSVISGGGFDSLTAKHDLAQEIAESVRPVRFLHIGDYDPSGVHVFSALDEDVRAFLRRLNPDAQIVPERIAVLPKHVLPVAQGGFGLQTAPKKGTDNRSFDGIGDDPNATVQAEALDPADLADLVEAALRSGWDEDAADRLAEREADERERLQRWLARSLEQGP
jgi:hypothetical protein